MTSIIGTDNATIAGFSRQRLFHVVVRSRTTIRQPLPVHHAGPFDQCRRDGLRLLLRLHGGETDQWTPISPEQQADFSVDGQTRVQTHTDMADEAIQLHEGAQFRAPDKPFFVYYVPGGSTRRTTEEEWSDKFKGKFDMGWNELREQYSPTRSAWE